MTSWQLASPSPPPEQLVLAHRENISAQRNVQKSKCWKCGLKYAVRKIQVNWLRWG